MNETTVVPLNYHHLQYFRAVAREGNLTRAAKTLRVAQSAISAQIRLLEEQLGQPLFTRVGRGLVLTEAGTLTLAFADEIVATGAELVSTLKEGRRRRHLLRVGAVATLSRNFQRAFLRPVLQNDHVRLRLTAASPTELLTQLAAHELDVVLSHRPAARTETQRFRTRRLARPPVSIVSARPLPGFRVPADLGTHPMILPGATSELRTEFDALCERLGVRPRIRAEVDDMATMRLLARDGDALVLVPSVVVRDELREGRVHELCTLPDVAESFYAITIDRRYQHPLLRELLGRDEAQLLDPPQPEPQAKPDEAPPPRRRRASAKPRRTR